MDDERRKKIEAGKLKLAEFKKKRHKNAKTKHVESPSSPRSTDSSSIKSADEKLESLNSSSTDSLTMKESKVPNKENMDSNLEMENSAALSEGSDDTAHLVNADTKLLSLYDQKIKKYQTAIQHKDAIIQKLTSSLESTMNANEAADSAGNKEVVYLKQEINSLQLQMKEAAEMLERQKSKLESQHACENESRTICETGVQVEITEIPLCLSNLSEETPPLEEVLAKFSKTPDLHEKLSNYLISNATETELQHFVKDLNHLTLTDHAAGDSEAVQPVQDNLQQIYPSDFSSLSRKLETLNVVAKLIESLVNASSRYSNESAGDFSCSKFQSFFLRRLNSTEAAEPYASESESVVSEINYAEVQPECEKSFVKNSSEFSAIEKLRNRVVADDFSLVTDFLLEEMDKISVTVPHLRLGLQGDITDVALPDEAQKIRSETTCDESEYNKFIQQKSKLESRLQHLKNLDQELQDAEQNNIQRSIDSDTLTNSEDNILLEEPPLSCVSLLSLTDSEYKIEYATTDSEANFSRKVSFDMSRPAQERGFCTRCDRCFDLMQERYDDHVCIFKEALENNLNFEKMEAVKKLESEIEKLRSEKEKQVELLCEEQELKLEHMSREYSEQLSQLQVSQSKWSIERNNFLLKIESLEEEITQSSKKVHDLIEEKAEVVDLVQELQQDLEDLKVKNSNELLVEKERLETEFLSSLERLKKTHEEAVLYLKCAHIKELEERETCLNAEHSKVINLLETTHSNESATYQKKIEQLLEEKCELLAKTTQEYEAILKKNHKALVLLCNHLRAKLSDQKEKMLNESRRSAHSEMEVSFSDALDELNRSIEQGIVKFLNQNYFLSDDEEKFDETEYLSFDIRQPVSESDFPPKKNTENLEENNEEESEKEAFGSRSLTQLSERAQSEGSLESDDMLLIRSEINKLQEEFQKDAAVYEHINAELHTECQALRQQAQELEDHKKKLEMQLNEKEKELTLKESQLAAIDAGSVK